jgi:pimeloyl-ACP methyl ester carboxylesterase
MARFNLVHGGWHGAWCWDDVAALLRADGHEVHVPTLTGLGERAHLLSPEVGLEAHIGDVMSTLEDGELCDVTLVGHSYAGIVTTAVADRVAERLAALVHLDAFVPGDGQALFDLLTPERRARYEQAAREHGDGWRVPPPPPAYLGVTDPAQAQWLQERLTPQPLRTFQEPARVTDAAFATALPRRYVHCAVGSTVPTFAPFAERALADEHWRYDELATGHDAMVTVPRELAALLIDQAAAG